MRRLDGKDKEIIALYLSGKSANEIGRVYKIRHPSIIRVLNKNNIKLRTIRQYNAGKLSIEESNVCNKYISGNSVGMLAKEYGVVSSSILKLLRRNNIDMRAANETRLINHANHTKISDSTMEMMDGWMLGDGGVYSRGLQSRFVFFSQYEEYAMHVKDALDNDGVKCNMYKSKGGYSLTTLCTLQFQELRNRWYPNGVKIIPKDLVLTSNTMKYWFIDDGTSSKRKGTMGLAVCCFTDDDCKMLVSKIKDFIGEENISGNVIRVKYFYSKSQSRYYASLYINRKDATFMLDKIGPCPVKCYEYKWNNVLRLRGV